jgi:hypothetical protein
MNCSFIGAGQKGGVFVCPRAHVLHKLFIEHQEKFRCRELLPVFWGNRTKEHETPIAKSSGTGKISLLRAGRQQKMQKVTRTQMYVYLVGAIWSGDNKRHPLLLGQRTGGCLPACLRNNETRS